MCILPVHRVIELEADRTQAEEMQQRKFSSAAFFCVPFVVYLGV